MYWADSETGEVYESNMDGTGTKTLISGLDGPTGLALDDSGKNIPLCINSNFFSKYSCKRMIMLQTLEIHVIVLSIGGCVVSTFQRQYAF